MNLHIDQLIRLNQNFNNFPQTAGRDFFCKYAWNIHLVRTYMVLYKKSHENIKSFQLHWICSLLVGKLIRYFQIIND